jgi:hypothetical protein
VGIDDRIASLIAETRWDTLPKAVQDHARRCCLAEYALDDERIERVLEMCLCFEDVSTVSRLISLARE